MVALRRRPQTIYTRANLRSEGISLAARCPHSRRKMGYQTKKTAQKVDLTKQVTLCRVTNQIPNTMNLLQNSSFSETNNCPREVVVSNISVFSISIERSLTIVLINLLLASRRVKVSH